MPPLYKSEDRSHYVVMAPTGSGFPFSACGIEPPGRWMLPEAVSPQVIQVRCIAWLNRVDIVSVVPAKGGTV
jgi:hypothetical protein